LEECGPCTVFASYALAFVLQLRKKHGKTSVRLAEEIHSIHIIKTPTHTHTYTHTHTHTHTRCSSSSFIVTLSPIRRKACACAQFSGCSSTTNSLSQTGQMAVCCQNLTLRAPSSRCALSLLVGALFKKVLPLF
jgi:hypothetical protein